MSNSHEADAAAMKAKAKAAYVREGERGWKTRQDTWERRDAAKRKAKEHRDHVARMNRIEENRLVNMAEAIFDSVHPTKARPRGASEADSPGREEAIMGNAVEEGLKRRRDAQQIRKDQLKKSYYEYNALKTEGIKTIGKAHTSVERATYEELIAAGWGDFERQHIPADWQTRPPAKRIPPASGVKLTSKTTHQSPAADDSQKLA